MMMGGKNKLAALTFFYLQLFTVMIKIISCTYCMQLTSVLLYTVNARCDKHVRPVRVLLYCALFFCVHISTN